MHYTFEVQEDSRKTPQVITDNLWVLASLTERNGR